MYDPVSRKIIVVTTIESKLTNQRISFGLDYQRGVGTLLYCKILIAFCVDTIHYNAIGQYYTRINAIFSSGFDMHITFHFNESKKPISA